MITAGELADIINAEVDGNPEVNIHYIKPREEIDQSCIVYFEKPADAQKYLLVRPAAIICSIAAQFTDCDGVTFLRSKTPKIAFALAMRHFFRTEEHEPGIHSTAVVQEGAVVFPGATVGANCFVGAGSLVKDGAVLWPGCVIGRNAIIGEGAILHANVTVLDRCEIGDRVILHSGVVIGSDGFGYVQQDGLHLKVPQVGNVIIEDDVEIGSNSSVDRATLGTTKIGRGTKIDNLVQIGHNCNIGSDCIICGAVGISGSVELGDRVILAGQVGISDHVKIGEGAILGGRSGVYEDIPAGAFYSGFPARPHRKTMRIFSALDNLPEFMKDKKA